MSFKKVCFFRIRSSLYYRICHCQLVTSTHWQQDVSSSKKKWKKKDIDHLVEWKWATNEMFGPLITDDKVNNDPIKGENGRKNKSESRTSNSTKIVQLHNDEQLDSNGVVHSTKDSTKCASFVESNDATDSQLNYKFSSIGDGEILNSSNYSETKLLTFARQETVNTSVNGYQSLKPIGYQSASEVVKDKMQPFIASNSSETFDYQWVDQPPEKVVERPGAAAEPSPSSSSGETLIRCTKDPEYSGNVGQETVTDSNEIDLASAASGSQLKGKMRNNDNHWSCADSTFSFEHQSEADRVNHLTVECTTVDNSGDRHVNKDSANHTEEFVKTFPLFITESSKKVLVTGLTNPPGRLPSVSKILQATQSPESRLALEKWENQMISELGAAGFAQYKADLFANGTNLHTSIELSLTGRSDAVQIRPGNEGHWQSIEPLLSDITGVQFVEHSVRHTALKYLGIVDCIAEYRGTPSIIEWKTSQRRKANIKSTFDNPLQLVAYLGAHNFQSSGSLQLEQCVLVIAYNDGNAADVHVMKKKVCLQYWSSWLQRLNSFFNVTDR